MDKFIDTNLHLWRINKKTDLQLKPYDGKIVTRFPPEPSGCLHIGHVKAMLINYIIAKKYNGKVLLRFDDTNPLNESKYYEDNINEDIQKLGIQFDSVSHTSDHFQTILEYANILVGSGLAYVDDSPDDTVKTERRQMIDSKNRESSICKNTELWSKMKNGEITNSILRLKIDMKHKNACMRDPTVYRSIDNKVYPTYDFACPIVDSIEGVTHVYRSNEFHDRNEQYDWILNMINLRKPVLNEYGRLNIQDTVLSKRKIKKLIDDNVIEGWNDPRLLTVSGAMRRGMSLETLTTFVARMGFSNSTISMEPSMLWGINRKYVDKIATRYTALQKNMCNEFKIVGTDEFNYSKQIPRFVRNPALGNRDIFYSSTIFVEDIDANMETGITLIHWGKVSIIGNNITLCLDNPVEQTDQKLLWIAKENHVPITIKQYGSITNTEDTKNTIVTTSYIGEPDMINIKKGDYVQLMKMGYYICDSIEPIVLIEIPNGRKS